MPVSTDVREVRGALVAISSKHWNTLFYNPNQLFSNFEKYVVEVNGCSRKEDEQQPSARVSSHCMSLSVYEISPSRNYNKNYLRYGNSIVDSDIFVGSAAVSRALGPEFNPDS